MNFSVSSSLPSSQNDKITKNRRIIELQNFRTEKERENHRILLRLVIYPDGHTHTNRNRYPIQSPKNSMKKNTKKTKNLLYQSFNNDDDFHCLCVCVCIVQTIWVEIEIDFQNVNIIIGYQFLLFPVSFSFLFHFISFRICSFAIANKQPSVKF